MLTQLLEQALEHHRSGRLQQAEELYQRILEADPQNFNALHLLSMTKCQRGDYPAAHEMADAALRMRPDLAELYSDRGNALCGLGRYDEAAASFTEAIGLRPDLTACYEGRGYAMTALGRNAEALADFDCALSRDPSNVAVHHRRGIALHNLARHEAALQSYDRAIELQAQFADAHCNRAVTLYALGQFDRSRESCEAAIQLRPDFAEAHFNCGNAQRGLKEDCAALASYDAAIRLRPHYVEAHYNRGLALRALGRLEPAVGAFNDAIGLDQRHAEAHSNRGEALLGLLQYEAALASLNRSIELKSELAEAHYNRGSALMALEQHRPALQSYETALKLKPDYEWLPSLILHMKRLLCDWDGTDVGWSQVETGILRGDKVAMPFATLANCESAAVQLQAAKIFVQAQYPKRSHLERMMPSRSRKTIHIGYFSADFHDHATSYLMAEILELHDRSQFEIVAFSFGAHMEDAMRCRVSAAVDRFIDVRGNTGAEIAELSRSLEIDIAVDLKGFTRHALTGIFAEQAAPLQVNFLGYPGTMGADYIDYLIADRTVIPEAAEQFYSEKVVCMPDSYQPNDSRRVISPRTCSRLEEGLPETGFVYCCFNLSWKISPGVFDVWMRILAEVSGSVLWLLGDNQWAIANLRTEAARRGVSPERLIFARPLPLAEHLARLKLADLFLDTYPYGAHTSASDSLWAGVPVLTRMGQTFASRVGASLLHAVGLPDLITDTKAKYEALAIELARDTDRYDELRHRLEKNRLTAPLFNAATYTRHLEAAYSAMHQRRMEGLPPKAMQISRLHL